MYSQNMVSTLKLLYNREHTSQETGKTSHSPPKHEMTPDSRANAVCLLFQDVNANAVSRHFLTAVQPQQAFEREIMVELGLSLNVLCLKLV